ncbi:valyl-tRNA synthetase [Sporolactobacillus inulinus]|uniref:Valine--tRNA ligase n=1 Tax=Sporolactobacillus inulinus TaxID=2078 RepID=A0A4Y1Z7Z7_9BACL|nr:valyl-tRNA synthetase [Sporolactobacillus inulinus]
MSGLINIDDEISRLKKELEKMNAEVERTKKKLSNPRFVDKAPEQVVNKEREKQADYIEKRDKLDARIAELQA